MATLDTMLMAGKEAPSEEPVPLVCPQCRSAENVTQTCMGFDGLDRNRATCHSCNWHGLVYDWQTIERLRRYVARIVLDVEPLASQP